jgi:hypothetical protein
MHRTAKIKRNLIVRYIPQKYLRLSTVRNDYLCYQWVDLATPTIRLEVAAGRNQGPKPRTFIGLLNPEPLCHQPL